MLFMNLPLSTQCSAHSVGIGWNGLEIPAYSGWLISIVVWVTVGQTWDWLLDCPGILTLCLQRRASNNKGTIHTSVSEPASWYSANNHLPNTASFISDKTEYHLLKGCPCNLAYMFITDSYGPPQITLIALRSTNFSSSRKHVFIIILYSPPNSQELWRVWALLYRGDKKLIGHSLMDASSRCETPFSMSKDFITHSIETSMKVSIHYA